MKRNSIDFHCQETLYVYYEMRLVKELVELCN